MLKLESIEGVEADDLELLEAAGWTDPRQLALASAEEVHAEMTKANGILRLVRQVPDVGAVSGWIAGAREMTGEEPIAESGTVAEADEAVEEDFPEDLASDSFEVADEPEPVISGPVNYEQDPEILEMLAQAPMAIPIPNRLLAEKGIPPGDISIAPVLNHAESDLEVRVTAKQRTIASTGAKAPKRGKHGGVVNVADSGRTPGEAVARRTLDTSRVKAMETPDAEDGDEPHLEKRRQTRDERLTLLRTTRESTNRGKKPGTRSYIRGVLHDRPYKVWFGCLIVLLFQITVPLSIVAAIMLIVTEHSPIKPAWVPSWIIAFPLALPVLGILYFMVSFGVKCRVCGQKVLVHRHCRKNKKAHHVWGLGYVLPLAVQTLLFRWFNCTFCGTSIRIKE